MVVRLKFWFFRHYWWVVTLAFISVLVFLLASGKISVGISVPVVGTYLSVIYFFQKQRLEEMKLFREIFAECNKRYDKLNDELNKIIAKSTKERISGPERTILNDYFNLCGEEYLYYRQGYLLPSVWATWFNGMRCFFENPRIAQIWRDECQSDSYYGLSVTSDAT